MDDEVVGRFWEIEESHLISMMERARDGESIDLILLENSANAKHVTEEDGA